MKNLILPLTLTLAGSLAFAAPPATRKTEPNAHGVAQSTSVRSAEATQHANGPRLVEHTSTTGAQKTTRHMTAKHSARTTARAQSRQKN